MRRISPFRLVIGVVLMAIGAVWFLQGIGLIGGGFMSGAGLWEFIGAIAYVAGLVVIFRPGRRT